MWWHKLRNQISSFGETDECISIGRGRQFIRLLVAEVSASAVVILDTPGSEVVWRVLATHCIRHFPLHFPSGVSLCAITFQLESACGDPVPMSAYPTKFPQRPNPVHRGYRPTNNGLNHGTVSNVIEWLYLWTTVSKCIKSLIWNMKVKFYWSCLNTTLWWVTKKEIAVWIMNLELHTANIQFQLPALVPTEERA